MARTYYNAGSSGRNYSRLSIQKLSNNHLSLIVVNSNGSSYSVELDQDQIRDFLVQLDSVKTTETMIEGNL